MKTIKVAIILGMLLCVGNAAQIKDNSKFIRAQIRKSPNGLG